MTQFYVRTHFHVSCVQPSNVTLQLDTLKRKGRYLLILLIPTFAIYIGIRNPEKSGKLQNFIKILSTSCLDQRKVILFSFNLIVTLISTLDIYLHTLEIKGESSVIKTKSRHHDKLVDAQGSQLQVTSIECYLNVRCARPRLQDI